MARPMWPGQIRYLSFLRRRDTAMSRARNMTPRERDALVATLLSMDDDGPENVRQWVLVAHVHENGECTGRVRIAGTTTDTEETVMMLGSAVANVVGHEELINLAEIDLPDSPEDL